MKLRIRVQGFVGIEIEIAIEIESFISAGHFSSIPIAISISISIWSFFSDKSARLRSDVRALQHNGFLTKNIG